MTDFARNLDIWNDWDDDEEWDDTDPITAPTVEQIALHAVKTACVLQEWETLAEAMIAARETPGLYNVYRVARLVWETAKVFGLDAETFDLAYRHIYPEDA